MVTVYRCFTGSSTNIRVREFVQDLDFKSLWNNQPHRNIMIYTMLCCHSSTGIASLCTVALIALERMFVVCKPLGLMTFERKHAFGGIALSWLWSLTWNLPPLFGWGRYELEGVGTSCAPDWHSRDPGNVSYVLAYFAVCFAVPFVVILTSYTRLLWTLHRVSNLSVMGNSI